MHLSVNLLLAFGFNYQLQSGSRKWALLAMLTWVCFPVRRCGTCPEHAHNEPNPTL